MPATLSLPRIFGNTSLVRLLDTTGDGNGSTDMSLNFVTPTIFKIVPPVGTRYYITEISVNFIATGGIAGGGYGSGAALTNGLQFEAVINGVLIRIPQLIAIKSNFELTLATNSISQILYQGNSTQFIGSLSFNELGIQPVELNGNTADEIKVQLEDDFTTRVATGEQSVSIYGSMFTAS